MSMNREDRPEKILPPDACRDDDALRRFVQANISANAWPIHCHSLRRVINTVGLDLGAAHTFSISLPELEAMMNCVYERSSRVVRLLGIDNAFHTVLHNFEVLVRLLVLEWPAGPPMPAFIEQAPLTAYWSYERVREVLLGMIDALLANGVPGPEIARDALAALGHDFGHSGGTDRTDKDGLPSPLTHEETAEKHVAKFGLRFGLPPALILESMAGIRATTFYSRPGRERITPATDFERRLTLADVMGCVLPPDQWLTHVGVPVLKEKMPSWRRRMVEIASEAGTLRAEERELPEGPSSRTARDLIEARLTTLTAEDRLIIRDIEEWFRSERGFFQFVYAHKLEPVRGALALWGPIIKEKIAIVEEVLARKDLLEPLSQRGFPFLEEYAEAIANVPSLSERLREGGIDPRLCELLRPFVKRC